MLYGNSLRQWLCAGAAALVVGALHAAIVFDALTGSGFVGKGDVQYTFGWNNAQLQAAADALRFRAESTVVTEISWICTNSNNERTQERERTTTTTSAGLLSHVARTRNQITGFNLTGYAGPPSSSSATEGPPLNSCPAGPWSLTTPAGDPELVSSETALRASTDGLSWIHLTAQP